MDFETLHAVIRSRVRDEYADVHGVAVEYDNAPFTKPNRTLWARCQVFVDAANQADFGASTKRYRYRGMLRMSIFSPSNAGDRSALENADIIKDLFRAQTISGVTFGTPNARTIGRVEGEYQINVDVPFYADEVA